MSYLRLLPKVAYYSPNEIRCLRDAIIPWFRVYRSNWRVLHIDGFERYVVLPQSTGHVINVFRYRESA